MTPLTFNWIELNLTNISYIFPRGLINSWQHIIATCNKINISYHLHVAVFCGRKCSQDSDVFNDAIIIMPVCSPLSINRISWRQFKLVLSFFCNLLGALTRKATSNNGVVAFFRPKNLTSFNELCWHVSKWKITYLIL